MEICFYSPKHPVGLARQILLLLLLFMQIFPKIIYRARIYASIYMARLFDKKKKLNGRKGKADMKNSKFNLEELSFQFGIYQNQEGYPILLSAVDLGRTEPDRRSGFTRRWEDDADVREQRWSAACAAPLPKAGRPIRSCLPPLPNVPLRSRRLQVTFCV